MRRRVLDLDDPGARDATLVGAKAASLSVASAAGLPVLPGVVVPVGESAEVVRAATRAHAAEGAEVGARRAAMMVEPDPELIGELRDRFASRNEPVIVRSSSALEVDGTWSGAFSSFHGITADDLGAAVRGCWGSAFSMPVLERARQSGTPVEQLGLAVLVQPEVTPDLGGTARLRRDGSVLISSTRGPLLPLMEGHVEGSISEIDAQGRVLTEGSVDASTVRKVADLVRQVATVLDHRLIEWAITDGKVHLLQSLRSDETAYTEYEIDGPHPALASAKALRVARLIQRFPGRLGYELVVPWAVAFRGKLPEAAASRLEPSAALEAARTEASALIAEVWGGSPSLAAGRAADVLRGLRGDQDAEALETLERLPPPSPECAAAVLGHLEVVRSALPSRHGADQGAAFWRLSPTALDDALAAGLVPSVSRFGADQWEPFLHRVATACGTSYAGIPTVSGAGAGRAHVVVDADAPTSSPDGRYVIVARQPVQALAPMLWNAAALVTRANSTGAHLIEFAHSLGVPTVVGCDLPTDELSTTHLVSVDGERGTVSLVDGAA